MLQNMFPSINVHKVCMLQNMFPSINVHKVCMLQNMFPSINVHKVCMLQNMFPSINVHKVCMLTVRICSYFVCLFKGNVNVFYQIKVICHDVATCDSVHKNGDKIWLMLISKDIWKYFSWRIFSSSTDSRRASCQLLVKELALNTGKLPQGGLHRNSLVK